VTESEQDTQPESVRDRAPGLGRARAVSGLGSRRGLWLLFLVAFTLRMAFLSILGSTADAESGVAWDWGWETACVAETILDGEPYGDPWGKGTGASAWLTPVYPGVVAACMFLGGGVTPTAALLLFGLHALLSAATCVLLVALGRALALAQVGLLAGWAFALYPASLWNAVTNVWDTTMIGFAVTGFFVLLLRAGATASGRPGAGACARLGGAFGALLLINPAPLGLLPGVLLYLALRPGKGLSMPRVGAFLAGALLICSPWMVRNQVVLGTPILRSNLGIEFHVGNNDQANGRHQTAFHPSHSERELALYRELGEVAYARASMDTALGWMGENPGRAARLILRRVQIFWVGESPLNDPRTSGSTRAADDPKAWIKWAFHSLSGLLALAGLFTFRRRTAEGLLLRSTLLLFPVPYYLTHVMERYRFPIDPLLVFLDVWVILVLVQYCRSSRSAAALPGDISRR
jgi:hypothetical protein